MSDFYKYFTDLFDYIIHYYHTKDIQTVIGKHDVSHPLFDRKKMFKFLDSGPVYESFQSDEGLGEDELDSLACFISNIMDIKGTRQCMRYIQSRLDLPTGVEFVPWYEAPGTPECAIRIYLNVDDPAVIGIDFPSVVEQMQALFDNLMWTCSEEDIVMVKYLYEYFPFTDIDQCDPMYVVTPTDTFPNLCPGLPERNIRKIGDGTWIIQPDPNPIGLNWVYDVSMNGWHGSPYPYGGAGPVLEFCPDVDRSPAFKFDGINDQIWSEFVFSPIGNFGTTTTIFCRFKITGSLSTNYVLISKGDGQVVFSLSYRVYVDPNGFVNVYISNDGHVGGVVKHYRVTGVNVNDGQWHTMAFRFDTGVLDIWVDDNKNSGIVMVIDDVFTTIADLGIREIVGAREIAGFPNTYDLFFEGYIGNVRWHREALTDGDILDIINLHTICDQSSIPAPWVWWSMDIFPPIEGALPLLPTDAYTVIGACLSYKLYYQLIKLQACGRCSCLFDLTTCNWDDLQPTDMYEEDLSPTTNNSMAVSGHFIFYGIDGHSLDPPLGPVGYVQEIRTVDFFGATPAGLGGTFFSLSTRSMNYYVWFDLDGLSTDPEPFGWDWSIRVRVLTGWTDIQMADELRNVLTTDYSSAFSVDAPGDELVTITNVKGGDSVNSVVGTSGLAILTTQEGVTPALADDGVSGISNPILINDIVGTVVMTGLGWTVDEITTFD